MKKRKICVVTGTRAEYGLLYWLMKDIQKDPLLELQIIATGMHCSPEFGLSYSEIEKDGFCVNKKIEMIVSADTPQSISKSTGLGLIGFADAYVDLKPDVIVVLGDRYELLAASTAAIFARIPIAHIHGGETTEGAFDEAIRHSITKMAWWHFVAADVYKKRVIQLGEDPSRVLMVGGLGVDGIKKSKLLNPNSILVQFLKTEIPNNKNLYVNTSINAKKIAFFRDLINLELKVKISEGLIDINETSLSWLDNIDFKISDSLLYMKDNNLILDAFISMKIHDYNEVYKFFQTPRNYRKEIKKIEFNLNYNFDQFTAKLNDIKIDNLFNKKINKNLKQLILNDNKLQNRIYFKNLMQKVIKHYAG